MSAIRRIEPYLLGAVAIGLVLRLWGIDWGLPAVYEEAYPFKKSWEMWGWGPRKGLDLNPHFFNYPTFYFYLQFLGQGFLFLVLKATGQVASVLDFRVLYELDKTPFYILGRGISALFGTATIAVTFAVARRVAGTWAGAIAAFLVAINHTHITKSQAIEVDVPMTLFSTLCTYFALRIAGGGTRRDYWIAGLCGGLAMSTKYNGALMALTIAVAHLVARRRAAAAAAPAPAAGRRPRPVVAAPGRRVHAPLALAALVFVAAFLLTSPYVVLDRHAFWLGFNYERQHMQIGHFGLDDTPTFLWYLRVLTRSLLGWPLALASAAGWVWFVGVRRTAWAWVAGVFPLVYIVLLSTWSMKAERYMIPLLPLAATFAAAFVVDQASRLAVRGARVPLWIALAATVAMAVPPVQAMVRERARLRGETRTLARQWIEDNVAGGSFVVVEPYGPEILGIIDVGQWAPDIRERIRASRPDMPIYALLVMPMYQVRSENSAIFYDLSFYDRVADCFVTSSSVGSRYRKDATLYAPQVAFYDSLAARWTKVKEFGPQDGSGPRIAIYRNPAHATPFSQRRPQAPPPPLRVAPDLLPGSFSAFFERLGFDYEGYGYNDAAVAVYRMGLRYADQPPDARRGLFMGAIRNSLAAGRVEHALAIIADAERTLPRDAGTWRRIRDQIDARRARADSAAVR
jgi:hypothetical protein